MHVTHEERLENLFILLSDNSQVATAYSSSVIDLPCDLDALHAIKSEGQTNVVQEGNIIKPIGICAIIWNINKQPKCFLGYMKQVMGPHKFEIEHLERLTTDCDVYWRYLVPDDIQIINSDQILQCKIDGTWDLGVNGDMMKFVLKNAVPINNTSKITKFMT